jgi:hypothetical protein
MSLTFDEAKHEYKWNGEHVPGVSEILKETGQAKDWTGVPTYYRDRGTATHKAISLYLKGVLDEDSVDPAIRPYLEQFKQWDQSQPLNTPITEQAYYSELKGFAGTLDLICCGVIYDIKCSKRLDKSSTWQYDCQGSGYRTLIKENLHVDYPFKILLLTGAGPAEVVHMGADPYIWDNVMTLYNLKTGHHVAA